MTVTEGLLGLTVHRMTHGFNFRLGLCGLLLSLSWPYHNCFKYQAIAILLVPSRLVGIFNNSNILASGAFAGNVDWEFF